MPRWHYLCVVSAMKPLPRLKLADMTTIFAVVGERRDDPLELLLLGDDGSTTPTRCRMVRPCRSS